MVEKHTIRHFVFVLKSEQTSMTTDELGKDFHMHARFYVKGKGTTVTFFRFFCSFSTVCQPLGRVRDHHLK